MIIPLDKIIEELDDIANNLDDFRCFFEDGEVTITDEAERAKSCVNRLDMLIERLRNM